MFDDFTWLDGVVGAILVVVGYWLKKGADWFKNKFGKTA